MKALSLLFTALLTCLSQANALGLGDSDPAAYKRAFEEKILGDFVKKKGEEGEFVGQKDIRIRFILFSNPSAKRSVTIVNGSQENYRKYFEIAYDFYNAGYSVAMLDHRGQGASGRILPNSPQDQYLDSFENFVHDLKYFHDHIVRFLTPGPRYLLGHSMGGCISTYYVEMYPQDYKAVALVAPMHSIKLEDKGKVVPEPMAMVYLGWQNFTGSGEKLVKPASESMNETFETSALTHSRARWQMGMDTILLQPSLRLNGITFKWMHEAVSSSIAVRTQGWAANAQLPVLLLQAERDQLILPHGQNEFCSNAPNCTLEVIKGAGHEILQEIDSIRTPAIERILKFFDSHASN